MVPILRHLQLLLKTKYTTWNQEKKLVKEEHVKIICQIIETYTKKMREFLVRYEILWSRFWATLENAAGSASWNIGVLIGMPGSKVKGRELQVITWIARPIAEQNSSASTLWAKRPILEQQPSRNSSTA